MIKKVYLRSLILAILGAIFLSGCGSSLVSNISVFHKLPIVEKKDTINFSFLKLEGQNNNLEYDTYQEKVRNYLLKQGYVEKNNSNILISIQYGIDNGREKLRLVPMYGETWYSPYYRGYGYGYRGYGYGHRYGYGYGYGYRGYGIIGNSSSSYTLYKSYLTFKMYDKDSKKAIYQANVTSRGSSGELLLIIDEMVEALFQNFPGENGTNIEVSIPLVR